MKPKVLVVETNYFPDGILRADGAHNLGNDVNFKLDYTFDNGMKLDIRSKYRYANTSMATLSLAGTGIADATSGYTFSYDTGDHQAGDAFTGNFNSRYLLRNSGYERNWMTTAELTGKSGDSRHSSRLGYNFWWERQGLTANTGVYAHTIEADPVWLKHDGKQGYARNTGGEYYDAHEVKTALYASDDWQVTNRLWLSAGVRLEYYNVEGSNAMAYLNATDETPTYAENIRNVDYSVNNGKITNFNKTWVNPAATLNGRLTLAKGFGVLGEYVYVMQPALFFCIFSGCLATTESSFWSTVSIFSFCALAMDGMPIQNSKT